MLSVLNWIYHLGDDACFNRKHHWRWDDSIYLNIRWYHQLKLKMWQQLSKKVILDLPIQVYIVSYTKNQPKSESVILPDQPSLINIIYSNKWYNLYKKVNRRTWSNNISYSVSDTTDSFVRPWLLKTEDIELIEKSIDACSWYHIFHFEYLISLTWIYDYHTLYAHCTGTKSWKK